MKELLDIFPFIKQTMLDLEKQNKFLNKVTLTGKINALNVAANLFEFTDKTAIIFDELKVELINALLQENIKKVTNELSFKAKTAIDILIRNLFERTADIGFFSTDSLICDYLTTEDISNDTMLKHLQEYASKYSVYNEIVIFDTEGNVKINMNSDNLITHTSDHIIEDALNSNDYIERYEATDIFKKQKKTLLYVQKITHNSKNIGVLCLCFKFDDELHSIFNSLSHNKELINISNKRDILASNATQKYTSYSTQEYKILKKNFISVTKKTSGYQGYNGLDGWFATAMLNATDIHHVTVQNEEETTRRTQAKSSHFLSQELNDIIQKANDIIEDISDVIINGELIASKQKVYVLTPILDNLRNISTQLLSSIKDSIRNLEYVVKEGLIHDVKMASHLAIDIMDRNLYERANDSRWWALTPLFKKELLLSDPDTDLLNSKLKYINDLYTVYTNIFIYDKNAKIIASSSDSSIIGTTLQAEYINKTLTNKNSQHYFVNNFDKETLYNNEATYIYSASIINDDKVVGGIGVVFDSTPEFKAMLDDSFPANKKGFMLFIDKNKKVIASSNPSIDILSTLDIADKFLNQRDSHALYDFIQYDGVDFVVASVISTGYREYKTDDNYSNELYCLTYIQI